MVGYLHFVGHGRRVRVAQHDVLGLTVWEARLPGSPESLLARRRMARGLDELEEAGCRRLLAPVLWSPTILWCTPGACGRRWRLP